jgi:hypothetical protein
MMQITPPGRAMPTACSRVGAAPPTVSNTTSAPPHRSRTPSTGSSSDAAIPTSAAPAATATCSGAGRVPTISTLPAPDARATCPVVMPIAPVPITTAVWCGPTRARRIACTPHA